MEKLIRVGHLIRYIREPARPVETAPIAKRIAASSYLLSEPQLTTNYILGGLADDQYQSKREHQSRVNNINTPDNSRAIQPVDGPISFPPINPSRVITSHHDALVLTLCINNFDVHRVPVDPGSAVDLLQLPTFRKMKVLLDKLNSAGRILSGFNGETTLTMGDIPLLVKAGPVT